MDDEKRFKKKRPADFKICDLRKGKKEVAGWSSEPSSDSTTPSLAQNKILLRRRRRWFSKRKIFTVVATILLTAAVFAGLKIFSLSKVIQRHSGIASASLNGDLTLSTLKGEGEGRINILLLGVGDTGHAGADLSDTMMVVSLDPKTKDAAMLGIPRDLWVKIPGHGYDKINAANALGEQDKPGSGPDLAKQVVSATLGIPIHYYARVDFSGLKQAVDSLGGIDINVPQDLFDPEYPCDKNENLSCGMRIAKGPQIMTGATALKYVRCRKGDCGNDFGRAARQQQVLIAMRDKALSLNIFTDAAKIADLFSIVGDHLRTDLQLTDIKRLIDLTGTIDQSKITTKVLDFDTTGLVRTTTIGDASVVVPTAGVGNFDKIQEFVRSIFTDGYIKSENAAVAIENDTASPSLTTQVVNLLKSYNYNIISAGPGTETNQPTTQLVDYTGGKKPYTLKYLENRFGTVAESVSPAPTANGQEVDIKLIIGANYQANP